MSTTLTYNTVRLTNVSTRRFSQECVYDESGTDLLFHRFRVSVVGYIHPNQVVTMGTEAISGGGISASAGLDAAGREVVLRALLLEPRKSFLMKVGDTTLLRVDPAVTGNIGQSGDIDLDNGPKPQRVDISSIVGTTLLRIEFDIELCRLDCDHNKNTRGVLNNRWSVSDSIDEDWYTTRTIQGRLRVAHLGLNPQAYRGWVIPPLQPGFKRMHIGVATTPDGLSLDYVVTDREVSAAPPWPSTTWQAIHTTIAGQNGATAFEDLTVRLTGPHGTSKVDLLNSAALIAEQKFQLLANQGTYVLKKGSIVDYMHENTVELNAQIQVFPLTNDFLRYFGARIRGLDDPLVQPGTLGYNRDLSPKTPNYGTATHVGLFVSYLQSPCNDAHQVPQTAATPPMSGIPSYGTGAPVTYLPGVASVTDPGALSNYSAPHKANIYTFYQVDSDYQTEHQVVQLPRAAIPSPGQDTCVFAQLGSPTTKRTVTIAGERVGAWPEIPKPESFVDQNGIRHRAAGHRVKAQAPKLSGDGRNYTYTIDATYHWLLSRPPLDNETFLSGSLPWDNTTPADNLIGNAVLNAGIAGWK